MDPTLQLAADWVTLYEIQGIQGTSATPATSPPMGALSTSVRMCGRGD
jgi:hypothetical protein